MTENKRWNMIEELHKAPLSYRDFEGLADPDKVIDTVMDLKWVYDLNDFQCDVMANLVYEYVDEGTGELPSHDELLMLAHAIKELTTTREWTKTGIIWSEQRN